MELGEIACFEVLGSYNQLRPAFRLFVLMITDEVDVWCDGRIVDKSRYPERGAPRGRRQGRATDLNLRTVLLRLLLHKWRGSGVEYLVLRESLRRCRGGSFPVFFTQERDAIRFVPDFVQGMQAGKALINVGNDLGCQLSPFLRACILPIADKGRHDMCRVYLCWTALAVIGLGWVLILRLQPGR